MKYKFLKRCNLEKLSKEIESTLGFKILGRSSCYKVDIYCLEIDVDRALSANEEKKLKEVVEKHIYEVPNEDVMSPSVDDVSKNFVKVRDLAEIDLNKIKALLDKVDPDKVKKLIELAETKGWV